MDAKTFAYEVDVQLSQLASVGCSRDATPGSTPDYCSMLSKADALNELQATLLRSYHSSLNRPASGVDGSRMLQKLQSLSSMLGGSEAEALMSGLKSLGSKSLNEPDVLKIYKVVLDCVVTTRLELLLPKERQRVQLLANTRALQHAFSRVVHVADEAVDRYEAMVRNTKLFGAHEVLHALCDRFDMLLDFIDPREHRPLNPRVLALFRLAIVVPLLVP